MVRAVEVIEGSLVMKIDRYCGATSASVAAIHVALATAGGETVIGVVLAAGVGSRLRPLTKSKPKCLVRVAGKAIIDYQIDAFMRAGVNELVIVAGYEAEALRAHCRHVHGLSLTVIENVDYESTNNMYSLSLVQDFVRGQSFILCNGDVAIEPQVVQSLMQPTEESLIAVDVGSYMDESMKVVVTDGFIRDISKEVPPELSAGCSIDFYRFTAADSELLFSKIDDVVIGRSDRSQWTELAIQELVVRGDLRCMPLDVSGLKWVEIDGYEDLAEADVVFSGIESWFSHIEVAFIDLDGTLFVGDKALTGVPETIDALRASNVQLRFITNNSSRDREGTVARLRGVGLEVPSSEVLLSTDSVVRFLVDRDVMRISVLGTVAMRSMLEAAGFEITDADPEYLIVGYDTELTYSKLETASHLINGGVEYVASHSDRSCPTSNGPIPDVGSIVEMLAMTTGRQPCAVLGKPSTELVASALDELGSDPSKVMVVGDRLATDVALANELDAKGILVLTGGTRRDEVEVLDDFPDAILPEFSRLQAFLTAANR